MLGYMTPGLLIIAAIVLLPLTFHFMRKLFWRLFIMFGLLLGYKETAFGDNDHKTLWLAVADGYRDGLRYINFTDNPWDRSLNERYRFMVIRLFRN